MPSSPASPPLDPAAVFRVVLREFLELDDRAWGSVTLHFVGSHRVRKVEWRILVDPDA